MQRYFWPLSPGIVEGEGSRFGFCIAENSSSRIRDWVEQIDSGEYFGYTVFPTRIASLSPRCGSILLVSRTSVMINRDGRG